MINQSVMKCAVSVIIPTYDRVEILLHTLTRIMDCYPIPDEIIVHVDGGDQTSEQIIQKHFPEIKVISSNSKIGPGGGRNKLIRTAKNEIIASFDDDSFPCDRDYFKRLLQIVDLYPDASVIASAVYNRNEKVAEELKQAKWTASFVGCGCAYKRKDFLMTDGYLNLPVAYGVEEVDLAMQLYAKGKKILQTDWLRVFHDTEHIHHQSAIINAASIANIALLAYIRYPWPMWGRAILQVVNRMLYVLRRRRYAGVLSGILWIPKRIWSHRGYRKPLSYKAMEQYMDLRKEPIVVTWK